MSKVNFKRKLESIKRNHPYYSSLTAFLSAIIYTNKKRFAVLKLFNLYVDEKDYPKESKEEVVKFALWISRLRLLYDKRETWKSFDSRDFKKLPLSTAEYNSKHNK